MELLIPIEFLGIKLFDEDLFELLIRSVFNVLIVYMIVRSSYLKGRQFNSHTFSFFTFSVVIFFVCHLMSSVKLDLGVAFGLFAIFAMLRYRTDPIPIREMTYLFVVMGVSVINALSNKKVSYAELLFTNFAIVAFIYVLERYGRKSSINEIETNAAIPPVKKKDILYQGLEHIKPEDQHILIANLRQKTGLNIQSINIQKINFQDETMQLKVAFIENDHVE